MHMNLKEAFRYQNYLAGMFADISCYLQDKRNLVCVKQEHLRKNANPEAQDETVDATTERRYAQSNAVIVEFMAFILDEKYRLSLAIDKAKAKAPVDVDALTAHNAMLRNMGAILARACAIKPSEAKTQGSDFKLNATGEQVRYVYDVKETTTIDFDRNKVKFMVKSFAKRADENSAVLDRCLIDVAVDFEPAFSVTDSTEDALEAFAAQRNYERRAV